MASPPGARPCSPSRMVRREMARSTETVRPWGEATVAAYRIRRPACHAGLARGAGWVAGPMVGGTGCGDPKRPGPCARSGPRLWRHSLELAHWLIVIFEKTVSAAAPDTTVAHVISGRAGMNARQQARPAVDVRRGLIPANEPTVGVSHDRT